MSYPLSSAYVAIVACLIVAIQLDQMWLRALAVIAGGVLLAILAVRR